MVVDRLKTKGLPLIPCSHTRGLQLENIINGIVDSHSVMCTQPSQQQPGPSQQQGIPLQDVDDDDNWEVEQASLLIEELANSLAKSPDIGSNKSTITSQSSIKKSAPRKRPFSMGTENVETPKRSPKRARAKSTQGPAVHKCDICDKAFYLPKDRDRHRVVHSQVRPYKCEKCDYCAKTAQECSKHYRRVHLHQYPHHCPTCNKGFLSKSKLIVHEKKHLNIDDKDKPFVCKHCGKGFFVSRELDSHLAVHEKDKRFKCDLCPFLSVTRKTRLRHLNETHQVRASRKTSMCLVCNKELHEYHLLIAHMKENHEIAGVTCEECGAMFPNNKRLEHHMVKEHLPDPECEECEETFKSKTQLTAHMKKHHWLGVECKQCGEMFRNDKQLETHMLESHSGWPEKFKEELQLDKTSQRSVVNDSEVTVFLDGEEQVFFTCKTCGGLFDSRNDLETHKPVHEGNGAQCDQCDLILGSQELLDAHVRKSHSSLNSEDSSEVGSYKKWEVSVIVGNQEKVYLMCKVCGDLFTSKSGLENHMVNHGRHGRALRVEEPIVIPERTRHQRAVAKEAQGSKESTSEVSPSVDTDNQEEAEDSGACHSEMSLKGMGKHFGKPHKKLAAKAKKAKKAEKKQLDPSTRSKRTILVVDRSLKSGKANIVVDKTVNQGQAGRVTSNIDKSNKVEKNQNDEVGRASSCTKNQTEMGGPKIKSEEEEDVSAQEKDHDYAIVYATDKTKEDKTKRDGTIDVTDKTLNQSGPDDTGSSSEKQSKGPPQVRIPTVSASFRKHEDCFTIYAKSPDHVAEMLAKAT